MPVSDAMHRSLDVIVAPATPWGRSALAVVRLSGEGLRTVLSALIEPADVPAGRPRRVRVLGPDGSTLDDGVVIVQDGSRTFTGEPTAELTVHGNPVLVERVLDAAQAAGARMARPGEFTRRAVLHGKLDLLQAEAIHQVIAAPTATGARLARLGLEGHLSADVGELRDALVEVAAELEARLDHPDDGLALADDDTLLRTLARVSRRARGLAATYATGRVLVHGARVALVGAVNAGKSSLFNALLGETRALVHDTPGTTRDVVEGSTVLDGVAVTLLDTAGERETDDPVEAAGLALAQERLAEVDLLLVVLRARPSGLSAEEHTILARTADRRRVVVLNGVDAPHQPVQGALATVATTGHGLQPLRDAIRQELGGGDVRAGDPVVASARQRDRLEAVARAADDAAEAMPMAGVAVAAELVMEGLEALDHLTGADTREDVLDALFARFCIGK